MKEMKSTVPGRRVSQAKRIAVGLTLLSAASATRADYGALQGPYDEPDSHVVDTLASGMALITSMSVAGVCGAAMLPADIYVKLKDPEQTLGAAYSEPVCMPAIQTVGWGTYFAAGAPLWAAQRGMSRFGGASATLRDGKETKESTPERRGGD